MKQYLEEYKEQHLITEIATLVRFTVNKANLSKSNKYTVFVKSNSNIPNHISS